MKGLLLENGVEQMAAWKQQGAHIRSGALSIEIYLLSLSAEHRTSNPTLNFQLPTGEERNQASG
jgi:hypothetical protein